MTLKQLNDKIAYNTLKITSILLFYVSRLDITLSRMNVNHLNTTIMYHKVRRNPKELNFRTMIHFRSKMRKKMVKQNSQTFNGVHLKPLTKE